MKILFMCRSHIMSQSITKKYSRYNCFMFIFVSCWLFWRITIFFSSKRYVFIYWKFSVFVNHENYTMLYQNRGARKLIFVYLRINVFYTYLDNIMLNILNSILNNNIIPLKKIFDYCTDLKTVKYEADARTI